MTAPMLSVCGIDVPWECQTLEGFREWVATFDEHGPRVSFSRGRVYVESAKMSPQNHETHEPLVRALNVALCRLAEDLDLGRYFLPPSWLTHAPSGLSTEPDGLFARWQTLESGELRVNPVRKSEMLGSPDMVLEVVSDSSRRKDLVDHVTDYALAGIREYWIADARGDEIGFRILSLGAGAAYADVATDADGWLLSPLWQRSFRIRRLPMRAGLVNFGLDIR